MAPSRPGCASVKSGCASSRGAIVDRVVAQRAGLHGEPLVEQSRIPVVALMKHGQRRFALGRGGNRRVPAAHPRVRSSFRPARTGAAPARPHPPRRRPAGSRAQRCAIAARPASRPDPPAPHATGARARDQARREGPSVPRGSPRDRYRSMRSPIIASVGSEASSATRPRSTYCRPAHGVRRRLRGWHPPRRAARASISSCIASCRANESSSCVARQRQVGGAALVLDDHRRREPAVDRQHRPLGHALEHEFAAPST